MGGDLCQRHPHPHLRYGRTTAFLGKTDRQAVRKLRKERGTVAWRCSRANPLIGRGGWRDSTVELIRESVRPMRFRHLPREDYWNLCPKFEAVSTLLLLGIVWLYIVLAPFNKVEESFNLQATHDILFHQTDLEAYDHKEFPGVVPRTFLGPLVVSILSSPIALTAVNALGATKLIGLYVVRACLGMLSVASFAHIQRGARKAFGPAVANLFVVLTALQFHLPFYMSRFLPNTFAMIITNTAMGFWVTNSKPGVVISLLVFTVVCFRCDVVLLLIGVSLHLLMKRGISFGRLVVVGLLSGVSSLCMTVIVDSAFWGRCLWPEGEVLWFNTILGKSSDWGVMPFHWYFVSALPRSLLLALPMSLLAPLVDRRTRPIMAVALLYVLLYSNLGHKEVRFLFPVLPLFNLCAACYMSRIVLNRKKSIIQSLLHLAHVGALAAMLCVSVIMLWASVENYPGGQAMLDLHSSEGFPTVWQRTVQENGYHVHVDVLPAMTGVSRFTELEAPWKYSKEEDIELNEFEAKGFTHLLSSEPHVPGFGEVGRVQGFSSFKLFSDIPSAIERLKSFQLPIDTVKSDQVFLHKRLG